MKRFLNNLKFKSKILFIVGALFFVTATVGGITYYHYAAQDVEKNFKAGAEDVLTQLTDTLDLRLNAVEMRVRGLVSNTTFMRTMVNYLNKPDEKNRVKALGEVASFLMENRWCIPPIFTQIKVILKILSGCAIGHLILKHQNFIRYIKNKVF